jgi:aminoglycoside phosphotransferase (APT) family kinase protein
VQAVWAEALDAPPWTGPRLWLHADLHAANVLTTGGALSGPPAQAALRRLTAR